MAKRPSKNPLPGQVQGLIPLADAPDFQMAEDQRRVKDVESARSIFNRFVQDNWLRSQTVTNTRGQLEGNRPFDPKILQEQGAAGNCNVNFGDAQANRDRALTPFWSRINDVPHKIAVSIDSDTPQAGGWEVAFAEAFDEFIADWNEGGDYYVQLMAGLKHMVDEGPGMFQYRHSDSPRFDAINTERVYFPKNARMSPESWDVWAVTRDFSPSEFYLMVKDRLARKTSADAGWNLKAVQQAIVYGMYGFSRDPRDLTRWQDDMVQNDINYLSPFQPMELVWLFVRQFDAKISARVFIRQGGVDEFLFESNDYAEKAQHIFGCIWYDTGVDSLIHSIKGFAIKNFHFAVLLNRMKCRMVDGATVSMAVNLQRTSDAVPDEAPPVENYGMINVFPPGLTQLAVYPQLQQGMEVISTLDQNRAENSAQYRQQQQKEIQDSDTATQANILATLQGQTTEASASVVLAQVGQIFSECMRRLRKAGSKDPDAVKFVKRLVNRGVPRKLISTLDLRVTTGANSGLADPVVRIQKFQQLLSLMNAPGVNGRWILEQYFASMLGANGAKNGLLSLGTASRPDARWKAIMENALFGQGLGQDIQVDPNDAHFEHLQEHLKALGPIAAQAQQSGQQPSPEHMVALTLGIEHSGQHMGYLQGDDTMKAQFQQVKPVFSQIQAVTRGLLINQQKQQQAQQQQPPSAPAGAPMTPQRRPMRRVGPSVRAA